METSTLLPSSEWAEKEGIIYLSLASNGFSGQDWIEHFSKTKSISSYGKLALESPWFKKTTNREIRIAIMRLPFLNRSDRTTNYIIDQSQKNGFFTPRAEMGCLIANAFSEIEIAKMKLDAILPMHYPLRCADGVLRYIYAKFNHSIPEHRPAILSATYKRDVESWPERYGFAFEIGQ